MALRRLGEGVLKRDLVVDVDADGVLLVLPAALDDVGEGVLTCSNGLVFSSVVACFAEGDGSMVPDL